MPLSKMTPPGTRIVCVDSALTPDVTPCGCVFRGVYVLDRVRAAGFLGYCSDGCPDGGPIIVRDCGLGGFLGCYHCVCQFELAALPGCLTEITKRAPTPRRERKRGVDA